MKQQPSRIVRCARSAAFKLLAKAALYEDDVAVEETIHAKGLCVVISIVSDDELIVGPETDEQSVNVRMGKTLVDDHESYDWTAQRWADFLGCTSAAVKKSRQWVAIMEHREGKRRDREDNQGEI